MILGVHCRCTDTLSKTGLQICDGMQQHPLAHGHQYTSVRATLMMKPQLEISQRLGADKGQYPTDAVGILSL